MRKFWNYVTECMMKIGRGSRIVLIGDRNIKINENIRELSWIMNSLSNSSDRAKYLFLKTRHVISHLSQDGGLEEKFSCWVHWATHHHHSSTIHSFFHHFFNLQSKIKSFLYKKYDIYYILTTCVIFFLKHTYSKNLLYFSWLGKWLIVNVNPDPFQLGGIDEWAYVDAFLQAIPYHSLLNCFLQGSHKLVIHSFLHQHSVGADTGLKKNVMV